MISQLELLYHHQTVPAGAVTQGDDSRGRFVFLNTLKGEKTRLLVGLCVFLFTPLRPARNGKQKDGDLEVRSLT